jgi:hypothetical protein
VSRAFCSAFCMHKRKCTLVLARKGAFSFVHK